MHWPAKIVTKKDLNTFLVKKIRVVRPSTRERMKEHLGRQCQHFPIEGRMLGIKHEYEIWYYEHGVGVNDMLYHASAPAFSFSDIIIEMLWDELNPFEYSHVVERPTSRYASLRNWLRAECTGKVLAFNCGFNTFIGFENTNDWMKARLTNLRQI